MKKHIDKAALVAEIERRIKERDLQMKSGCWVSSTYMYEDLLDFINTLEVKEVNDNKWLIKATEWLSANLHRYDESIGLGVEEFVERFKKAMKR